MIDPHWTTHLHNFAATAVHVEFQPFYAGDDDEFAAWKAGHRDGLVVDPAWGELVSRHVAAGRSLARVRVFQEPPTEFQEFERWVARRMNIPAGEEVRYMTERVATNVGLLPDANDFWLLDSQNLLLMFFDDQGRLEDVETTSDPQTVSVAQRWWDLALANSVTEAAEATAR